MTKTTFAGASPWAGLPTIKASSKAKEKPMPKRAPPPKTKAEARQRSNENLKLPKVHAKGEACRLAKLKKPQVVEIVAKLKRYQELRAEIARLTPEALAKEYGVAENTIRSINDGRSWLHVSGFPAK